MIEGAHKLQPKEVIGSSSYQGELRLIRTPGFKSPPPKSDHRFLYTFIAVVVSAFGLMIYFALDREGESFLSEHIFTTLQEVYQKEGIKRFLAEKERLKRNLAPKLSGSPFRDEHKEASNIALYLFPEILPDEDFEKEIAMEDWGTFQKEIEKSPGSPESRKSFEEMRANIWNYENPSSRFPVLSPQAKQVIQIYQGLSAP